MTSACSYGQERLVDLLYEDGDRHQIAEVRAHLAECAGCRAELEQLVSTRGALAAWPNVAQAPRLVYVNDPPGWLARVRRWTAGSGGPRPATAFKPIAAVAAVVLVVVASAVLFDLRVAPDGSLHMVFGSGSPAAGPAIGDAAGDNAAAISREEFEEGLTRAVSYIDELFRSRNDEERRLLLATIEERMQEQGLAMSRQLRGAVEAAFADLQRQHENDLGLVFSAIDELGVVTGTELQRMNAILGSLAPLGPRFEEEE